VLFSGLISAYPCYLIKMAATPGPGTPDFPEEEGHVAPPVYEVEEQLVERRISSVPVQNDRRGSRGSNPPAPPAPPAPESESGKKDGQ
jgi:hypothetical protein